MIHPEHIKWSLQKSLRGFPDAQITDDRYDASTDAFRASIKRGRKTSFFLITGLEIIQAGDKLDEFISARATTTMLRN